MLTRHICASKLGYRVSGLRPGVLQQLLQGKHLLVLQPWPVFPGSLQQLPKLCSRQVSARLCQIQLCGLCGRQIQHHLWRLCNE